LSNISKLAFLHQLALFSSKIAPSDERIYLALIGLRPMKAMSKVVDPGPPEKYTIIGSVAGVFNDFMKR
jgi:hypothetical protein